MRSVSNEGCLGLFGNLSKPLSEAYLWSGRGPSRVCWGPPWALSVARSVSLGGPFSSPSRDDKGRRDGEQGAQLRRPARERENPHFVGPKHGDPPPSDAEITSGSEESNAWDDISPEAYEEAMRDDPLPLQATQGLLWKAHDDSLPLLLSAVL